MLFLEFRIGSKGFKVYDLTSKRVIMSRDITFYEDKFPFIESSYKVEHVVPPLPHMAEVQEDLLIEDHDPDQEIMPARSQPPTEPQSNLFPLNKVPETEDLQLGCLILPPIVLQITLPY